VRGRLDRSRSHSWPRGVVAFVPGAIVSTIDPLAAATIMRCLDTPRPVVSSIEGEGLFNGATALVAYRVVVAAVVAGSNSAAIHDCRADAVVAVFPGGSLRRRNVHLW
jgi:NhaP-type Na+/H+ or K+/H+ antiporter